MKLLITIIIIISVVYYINLDNRECIEFGTEKYYYDATPLAIANGNYWLLSLSWWRERNICVKFK